MDAQPPSGSPDTSTEPVGATLARLRRDRGLTGRQLGQLVDLSQATVSRLETGVLVPDPVLIHRIAAALDLPTDQVRALVDRADKADNQMTDWRLRPPRAGDVQHDYVELESSAKVLRSLQIVLPHALLQTSEFARAILTSVQPQWLDGGDRTTESEFVVDAVAERVRRQKVLTDPRRRFHFLMSEAALYFQVCRPEDMPAQILRIRDVARQKNVTVRMIPMGVRWASPPLHGFEIFDDRYVITELFNTVVVGRGRHDLHVYLKLFADIDAHATSDIEPILDSHLQRYLDLSRPVRRPIR